MLTFISGTTGHVGVNTTDPQATMHIRNNPGTVPYLRISHTQAADNYVGEAGGIKFYKHHDHFESVKIYLYADWYAYGGTNYQGSDLRFATTPRTGNGIYDRMVIKADGTVGIGTNDPKGYQLAVAGSMVAESVKVKLQGFWPDYVFTPTFRLRPLSEVSSFIQTNGHLPDVPSAQEVKENGLDVASTDAMLLQKIEELTLYLLDQNKQLQQQSQKLEELKKENEAQSKELENLKQGQYE